MKEDAPPPVPSGVIGEWFPASVRLPGSPTALHKQRVFAAPEGLYIYSSVPSDQAQAVEPTPNWFSPINFELTAAPPAPHSQASKLGFVIKTDAGPVTVQWSSGCACGVRALQAWRPVWSTSRLEWRASA